jgi:hypothetical protein
MNPEVNRNILIAVDALRIPAVPFSTWQVLLGGMKGVKATVLYVIRQPNHP